MVTESAVKPFCVGIDGVSIRVFDTENDIELVPDSDGYIPEGEIYITKQVSVRVEIEPGYNIFGFSVDGKKNITPAKAKNYSQTGRVYRKKVPIHIPIHKGKGLYTQYNENHIKLLQVSTDGYFAVWEVAIVFQNGSGFLTTQRVYEGFVYMGYDDEFSCPEFDGKWPQLIRFIGNTCNENGFSYTDFPYIDEYASDPEKSMDNEDDGVGRVKWYNVAQGFGAISTNKGDAFVHYKDIDSPERLICLEARDMVLFEKLIPNTSYGKGFPYKAVGVLAPEA